MNADEKAHRERLDWLSRKQPLDAQAERIAELEAMLSELEWCMRRYDICPICGSPKTLGHDDDCRLDAVLHKEAADDHKT